ncbi:hypothetical protein TanjilG_17891 [Lupinus angustifolius]|uniref:Uncharacterized protein n=1 Tax=Lupinus angustifolius TaxID=3871 RepID=A0A4P1QQ34_LUPAN|nr:hypothetical protein TanjilG_17891 [Lupinus angustifolius]
MVQYIGTRNNDADLTYETSTLAHDAIMALLYTILFSTLQQPTVTPYLLRLLLAPSNQNNERKQKKTTHLLTSFQNMMPTYMVIFITQHIGSYTISVCVPLYSMFMPPPPLHHY